MEIINGFACKTCTDVAFANRHIDPAHPKDGPYGLDRPAPATDGRGLGPAAKVAPEAEKGLGPARPPKPTHGTGQVLDVIS